MAGLFVSALDLPDSWGPRGVDVAQIELLAELVCMPTGRLLPLIAATMIQYKHNGFHHPGGNWCAVRDGSRLARGGQPVARRLFAVASFGRQCGQFALQAGRTRWLGEHEPKPDAGPHGARDHDQEEAGEWASLYLYLYLLLR